MKPIVFIYVFAAFLCAAFLTLPVAYGVGRSAGLRRAQAACDQAEAELTQMMDHVKSTKVEIPWDWEHFEYSEKLMVATINVVRACIPKP